MKSRLEQLVYDAGERMKELQNRSDKLYDEWYQTDKVRARYSADITAGSKYQSDIKNLSENTEKCKGFIEQLDRIRSDLAAQQQYVTTVNNQYLDLVRAEKGLSTAPSQYASNSNNSSTFYQSK